MPKLKELLENPPPARGGAEAQIQEMRNYLYRIVEELQYLLTHLESDNTNSTLWDDIDSQIPKAGTSTPLMDGVGSAGSSARWSRENHRHPADKSKADAAALEAHVTDYGNPHRVTKSQVGLGNVADVLQYSEDNPPPIPSPAEVGAVPVEREINGYALSADVDLDYSDVGAIPATDKGSAGGVAELDNNGMVLTSQLPSYVDDVLEYPTYADFPAAGETGKIYVAIDTNITYRWSGSGYVEISASLALGETAATAYRGDRGKIAYDHSQTVGNPHLTTAAEVGARPDDWMPSASDVGARADDWMPTAADVGARPDTWTPTASDVGARPDTWTPTAADVGARPDSWVPDAEDVPYDNSLSGLMASDLQAAVDELAQGGGGGSSASVVSYDNTGSGLTATNVQDAIDEVYGDIPAVPSASTATPQIDGTAAPGSSTEWARGDHVHPVDTSRASQAQLATVESGSTASRAYSVGEYFCMGGLLYRVTAAISSGQPFSGGNSVAATVGEELSLARVVNSSGRWSKQGNIVIYSVNSWTTASSTTIPAGYRPKATVMAYAEAKSGSATSGNPTRITFNTNGSVTLAAETSFVGTFVWFTN